jgi:hypothetical protein
VSTPKRITKLRVDSIDGVDLGAAVEARITLMKRREGVAKDDGTEIEISIPAPTETKPMTLEEVLAKLTPDEKKVVEDAMAAASAAAQQQAEKAKDPEAEMMKRLPEEIRKRMEEDAQARVELQKRLDRMEDENVLREHVEKARKLSHGVPGLSHTEVAEVTKAIAQKRPLPEAVGKKLEQSFTAVNELIAKSKLFAEEGSSQGGGGDGSAESELKAIAKRLTAEEKIPAARALAEAAKRNPELHARMRAEQAKRS